MRHRLMEDACGFRDGRRLTPRLVRDCCSHRLFAIASPHPQCSSAVLILNDGSAGMTGLSFDREGRIDSVRLAPAGQMYLPETKATRIIPPFPARNESRASSTAKSSGEGTVNSDGRWEDERHTGRYPLPNPARIATRLRQDERKPEKRKGRGAGLFV